jgi:hypothetical protein
VRLGDRERQCPAILFRRWQRRLVTAASTRFRSYAPQPVHRSRRQNCRSNLTVALRPSAGRLPTLLPRTYPGRPGTRGPGDSAAVKFDRRPATLDARAPAWQRPAHDPPAVHRQVEARKPVRAERLPAAFPPAVGAAGSARAARPQRANGAVCDRRVPELYLPPGARYFGCPHGHQMAACLSAGVLARIMHTLGLSGGGNERKALWPLSFCTSRRPSSPSRLLRGARLAAVLSELLTWTLPV